MTKNKPRSPIKTNLTQAEVKAMFDYDAENGWLIRKFRNGYPYNKPCGHKPTHSNGYGRTSINGTDYLAHRLIWLWHKGTWPQFEIDHIDQNKMNNRIENLRDVEHTQNEHNKGLRVNNTTGYPGVSLFKRTGRYRPRLMHNGQEIYFGYFDTAEEAFLAYQLAKIKYHPTSPDAKKYAEELGITNNKENVTCR